MFTNRPNDTRIWAFILTFQEKFFSESPWISYNSYNFGKNISQYWCCETEICYVKSMITIWVIFICFILAYPQCVKRLETVFFNSLFFFEGGGEVLTWHHPPTANQDLPNLTNFLIQGVGLYSRQSVFDRTMYWVSDTISCHFHFFGQHSRLILWSCNL